MCILALLALCAKPHTDQRFGWDCIRGFTPRRQFCRSCCALKSSQVHQLLASSRYVSMLLYAGVRCNLLLGSISTTSWTLFPHGALYIVILRVVLQGFSTSCSFRVSAWACAIFTCNVVIVYSLTGEQHWSISIAVSVVMMILLLRR